AEGEGGRARRPERRLRHWHPRRRAQGVERRPQGERLDGRLHRARRRRDRRAVGHGEGRHEDRHHGLTRRAPPEAVIGSRAERDRQMAQKYWLMKSEPYKYSFGQLLKDRKTTWDGVRNFEARNYMRSMVKGDLALFYHSNEGKEVVGVMRVDREAYDD